MDPKIAPKAMADPTHDDPSSSICNPVPNPNPDPVSVLRLCDSI